LSTLADIQTTSDDSGVVIARIAGEMDASNTSHVENELTAAVPNSAPGMVLDLSDLSFVDSSGVELFFRLGERLEDRRQRLAVALPEGANAAADCTPLARVAAARALWVAPLLRARTAPRTTGGARVTNRRDPNSPTTRQPWTQTSGAAPTSGVLSERARSDHPGADIPGFSMRREAVVSADAADCGNGQRTAAHTRSAARRRDQNRAGRCRRGSA
jgi:anti-anti-sigma factor